MIDDEEKQRIEMEYLIGSLKKAKRTVKKVMEKYK